MCRCATPRRYRPGTLALETEFTTASGVAGVVDCMPLGEGFPSVDRLRPGGPDLERRVDVERGATGVSLSALLPSWRPAA